MKKAEKDIPDFGGVYKGYSGKSAYPSGGGRNGYGENSNDGGSKLGGSLPNSYGNNSVRSSIDSSSASSTFKSIVEITTGAKNGTLLMGERIINLYNGSLTNEDIGVLMNHLQYQGLNLDKFDVSYNKLGYGAVENMFYTFSLQRSNTALYNIKFINLSNNQIGDDGAKYIASHIENGNYPHLKALDVSGNQISNTGQGYFAEAMQSSKVESLLVTFFKEAGSKGKEFIKSSLKTFINYAKQQGVDTTDIATDKGIYEYFKDVGKISSNIIFGTWKCSKPLIDVLLVDTTVPSMAKDVALEMYGNKFIKKADLRVCIALEIHDALVSAEGVDLAIKTVDLLGE